MSLKLLFLLFLRLLLLSNNVVVVIDDEESDDDDDDDDFDNVNVDVVLGVCFDNDEEDCTSSVLATCCPFIVASTARTKSHARMIECNSVNR
jgi:hypothetical protein